MRKLKVESYKVESEEGRMMRKLKVESYKVESEEGEKKGFGFRALSSSNLIRSWDILFWERAICLPHLTI